MLRPLQVTIVVDETITPRGPKMTAAIHPANGWFYRINTKPWRPAVLLERDPHHRFLAHDSCLECGDPLELDDDLVERNLRRHGIIGEIHRSKRDPIRAYLRQARFLCAADKEAIIAALDELGD